jgi:hypothetical protein
MIYFLVHPDAANYQWDVVPLAEGLEALGKPFFGSANYWRKPDGTYLIRKSADIDPLGADAVVVSTGYLNWTKENGVIEQGALPQWMNEGRAKKARFVAMDVCDGYLSSAIYRWGGRFDVVLRSHFNARISWPSNVRPWAFGLSNRMIEYGKRYGKSWFDREGCIFAFGASHGYEHTARERASELYLSCIHSRMPVFRAQDDLTLPPGDEIERDIWQQCARRHSAKFFARVGKAKLCATFCGDLVPGLPWSPDYLVGGKKAALKRSVWAALSRLAGSKPRNIQADSWRFWETLACGAIAINFDADESGWKLPAQPQPGVHYLATSLCRGEKHLGEALCDDSLLHDIAQQGSAWAMREYAPAAVAARLLDIVAKK